MVFAGEVRALVCGGLREGRNAKEGRAREGEMAKEELANAEDGGDEGEVEPGWFGIPKST